jgi:hypothetical protein
MQSSASFTWDRAKLSHRENEMFGALLDVYMMAMITQLQVRSGAPMATSEDAKVAFRAMVEWAKERFRDLDVREA